jgi:hypothetical protein
MQPHTDSPHECKRAKIEQRQPPMQPNVPPNTCRAPERRGVLLLVVLSLLTLFLLLGTTYLIVSTRSRETARAFNRLITQTAAARVPSERFLDAALLRIFRGGAAPVPVNGVAASFESLLADKYGLTTTCTGAATTVTEAAPLLIAQATLSSTSGTVPKAVELPGRVLTFLPGDGSPTSHRILAATPSGSGFTLTLDNPPRPAPFRTPSGTTTRIVVNGREFDGTSGNEGWDGFDHANNAFLAHVAPVLTSVASSTVSKPSFLPTGTPLTTSTSGIPDGADNDNDGVLDGLFFNFGFPGIPTASGTIDLHASVLIVDLDSRFNVNAHGSLARRLYPSSPAHPGWPTAAALSATGTSFTNVPLGSGYGPAEVNGDAMFPQTGTSTYPAHRLQAGETPTHWLMTGVSGSSLLGMRPTGSRFSQATASPRLQSLQGRYGEKEGWDPGAAFVSSGTTATPNQALPGRSGLNDPISAINDYLAAPTQTNNVWTVDPAATLGIPSLWWDGSANFNWGSAPPGGALPRASYNSPPDLHGRMKTMTVGPTGQGVAPRLLFAKPEWGAGETTDDPYELRLDARAARNGWYSDPNSAGFMPVYDNVFSPSDLEAVLRPYDIDSMKLPLRLAGMLGSLADEARLRMTTDSWDTTMISGSAATNLSEWIQALSAADVQMSGTSSVTGAIGGEIARAERFDLNRPLMSAKPADYVPTHPYYVQRQAYFKDLYTLLCALLHPAAAPTTAQARTYAQWAANVVEYRDADSTMTPFEYDENPFDGWQADNDARTSGEPNRQLVWGAERPEMLIAATSAWEDNSTGELFIMLHRPWNALAFSSGTSTPAEPLDSALDTSMTSPTNLLDLGNKSGQGSAAATYPVWRLRIVDGTNASTIVRLDDTSGSSGELSSSAVSSNPATTPKLAIDSWLCLKGSNTINAAITATNTVTIDQGGSFRVPGTLPSAPGLPPRLATVYLERLSDPAIEVSPSTNQVSWTTGTSGTSVSGTAVSGTTVPVYRVVDQASIEVVNRVKDPITGLIPSTGIATTLNRNANNNTTLWGCLTYQPNISATASSVDSGPTIAPFTPATPPNNAVWFTWPNRPFVSAAELLFVPSDDALALLAQYTKPSVAATKLPTPLLFDAVHVPTRFAGIHQTVTQAAATAGTGVLASKAGIYPEVTPVNQLSSYREPGRVNLNTVTSDDLWNAVVAGPLVQTGTSTPDPVRGRSAANFAADPAKTTAALLSLSGAGTLIVTDTNAAIASGTAFNPAHSIYTATRLANTATIRSNVFAVWITLRESVAGDPDSVRYHRGFYIVDRSIPVAHEPGKDHNVWDAVILRRIVE